MARFDSNPPVKFDTGVRLDSGPGPGPAQPKKKMAEPALKLAQLARNDKKTLAGALAAGLTANPALVPTPKVTPAQLTTAAQAITDQELVVKTAETDLATQRKLLAQKDDALDVLMTTSVDDSAAAVSYDPISLSKLNIPVKAAPGATPAAVVGAPQNFSVTQGDHSGEADGHCDAVKGAKLYRVQQAASPSGPWTTAYEGTKSKFTVAGLTPGQEVWFQMSAFVNGQWSDWSDPAKCRIV